MDGGGGHGPPWPPPWIRPWPSLSVNPAQPVTRHTKLCNWNLYPKFCRFNVTNQWKKCKGSLICRTKLLLTLSPPDWPSAQSLSAQTIGAGSLGFDSQANQISKVSPPLRRFFGAVEPRRKVAEMGPATRYTLRRNTASMMIFDWFCLFPPKSNYWS